MSTREDVGQVLELADADYDRATVEVAFLLQAFATTIDDVMGGNIFPVGRIAGRDTARRLPLHLPDPTPAAAVAAVAERMRAGFAVALDGDGLTFGRCIVRELCALRGIELGGPLCRLYHAYFDGILNGLLDTPVRSELVSVGENECLLQTVVQ